MKKKTGILPFRILMACFMLGLVVIASFPAKAYAATESRVSDIVSLSGITKNSKGSNVVKNNYVTREELAQLLVQASPYSGNIEASKSIRLFRDVTPGSAKAEYIQLAVAKGYMSGYLDGNFKPKQTVTLREAAYGMLMLLGYSNEDFSGKLSGSRFEKFKELGLNNNINGEEKDRLKASDCEELFYNLLNAKGKTGEVYAVTLGYTLNSDNKVDYQSLLKKKTKGPLLVEDGWQKKLTGKLSSYKVYRNEKKIAASGIKTYSVAYYANQARTVWVYDSRIFGTLENITYSNGKAQEFTVGGNTYTVESPDDIKKSMDASGIEKGSMVILLLGREDKVSYLLPMKSRVAGGNWKQYLGFDPALSIIYKNGNIVTANEVKSTDVIYYNSELKTVWVYGKTIYGVMGSISPSRAVPTQVTVAGVTYTLDRDPVNAASTANGGLKDITENAWGKRLRENNIQEGDNVAVSFGYDGKIAEITRVDRLSVTLSGYVLDIKNKVVKNGNQDSNITKVIHIVETGGTVMDLECDDTSIEKGSLVEITFNSGKMDISRVTAYACSNITDLTTRAFAENARILSIKDSNYTKLTPSRMKEISWNISNAMYCKLDSEGKITDLILKSSDNFFSQYGLLTKLVVPDYDKGIYNYQLTMDMGEETTFSVNNVAWDLNPGPKAVQFEGNVIKSMKNLTPVKILYITGKQANSGSSVYRIDDKVLVYYYKNGEYYKGDFDSLSANSNGYIEGYVDDAQGPIYVIIVKK